MLNTITHNLPLTDVQIYIKQLNEYKKKFITIAKIEEGDKIGKDIKNNKYTIYKEGLLQKLWRRIYFEDRKTSFLYISNDFSDFFGYYDSIKNINYGLNPTNPISTIDKILIEIITNVIPGLYNLKKSYYNPQDKDGQKLCCKIDSIILTLIDMKDEINKKNTVCFSIPKIINLKNKKLINTQIALSTANSF